MSDRAPGDAPLEIWHEREGALLRLRLARPKPNVLDAEMIAALDRAFTPAAPETGGRIRAVLLDHQGPHFSFGASVQEHLPAQCAGMLAGLHGLLGRMLESPWPILVAARGQCLGGGLELACAGTLLFVGRDAQLGQPEIKLGVFAPAASVLLPARMGSSRAEDLLYSGRSIDAPTALDWGLAHAVSDDPEADALDYFDSHLAGRSAPALGFAVKAARGERAAQVRRRLAEVERLYLSGLMQTRDAVEGLEAFLEKRAPEWQHR